MATGLATRCPACGTVFRVVPDQLRVSEGWVRCGRCADVFNAAEALVDLETGAPRRMSFEPPPPPPPPAPPPALADFRLRTPPPLPQPAPPPDEPPATVPVIDTTESRFSDDAVEAYEQDIRADADDRADTAADHAADTKAQPSFLRRAERAQRWRQPRVRAALAVLGLLAALGLAAQVGYEYRDLIAARHPAAKPALDQACQWLGCAVGAARAIDAFSVESSGLVRVEKSAIYKLSVALRNRAAIEVALPALELALTDSQGKLLARRVLRPIDLGSAQATLPAGRDLSLQATLQLATEPVAGYTVELFYP
jgi:predicted Zn finger-like uncharacterized protein